MFSISKFSILIITFNSKALVTFKVSRMSSTQFKKHSYKIVQLLVGSFTKKPFSFVSVTKGSVQGRLEGCMFV